jgi:hypothetical protein
MITAPGVGRSPAAAELFEDVGTVGGDGGLLDVVLLRYMLGGVPELSRGALGVGLLVDERGDGLAEGVRRDPLQAGVSTGLAPLSTHVVWDSLVPRREAKIASMGLSAAVSLRAISIPTVNRGRTTVR